MALVSDASINALRQLKAQGYTDTAVRRIRSVQATSYSYGRDAYTDGNAFACRFLPKPSPDLLPGTDVQMTDADLFFGLGQTLLPDDRISITHLHGDEVSVLEYAVVAGPVRTSLGQRVTLRLVQE